MSNYSVVIEGRVDDKVVRVPWCVTPGSKIDKKYIGTSPKIKNVLKSYWKLVENNITFIRIHGAPVDQITNDIDLTNKTCLITGANNGIGLEMTKCLNSNGCNVLMASRNSYAANNIIKYVVEKNDLLRFYDINLASLKSVKNCCNAILKNEQKIDMVILNAGVFGLPWTLTEDGLETTFQVNYLSQIYLLMNIEKLLTPDARVIFVSSESHRNVNWTLHNTLAPTEDLVSLPKNKYTSIKAYNISKLCGILAMHYLGYRWLNTGKAVFCAHPGTFVKTSLCRNWWIYETLYTLMKPFAKSISQAASTPIYCAISPDLKGLSALYYKDCQRCEESDLAKDLHLSFRMHDLTQDILRERVKFIDDSVNMVLKSSGLQDQPKEIINDNLVSNYTGQIQ
ncbi:WW domain-containing oxidoreductase-like [Galleria mellonella]|uniref:WW domain-containing oxidoreductase-like n=1 Tax=Galleria mellonella TaxID=7137 RepID=A0A6J1WPA7_GALME|nr:WW domain-containing oxidoreductase-like [Galleria mellonella]